jgi:hypothetical protein
VSLAILSQVSNACLLASATISDRKPFAANPAGKAGLNNTLEDMAENVAVAEPLITGTRERLNRETTEPAIGQLHLHITA